MVRVWFAVVAAVRQFDVPDGHRPEHLRAGADARRPLDETPGRQASATTHHHVGSRRDDRHRSGPEFGVLADVHGRRGRDDGHRPGAESCSGSDRDQAAVAGLQGRGRVQHGSGQDGHARPDQDGPGVEHADVRCEAR
ncbi:hypothetical protein Q9Q99_02315 [Curtobacterium flaccumfaciens]|nr:hypothetical protein Q9Q99_02315 [Curtobacterium flaccumfaciens]